VIHLHLSAALHHVFESADLVLMRTASSAEMAGL
jgi:hypothetical protein